MARRKRNKKKTTVTKDSNSQSHELVKQTFQNQTQKYDLFEKLLKELKDEGIFHFVPSNSQSHDDHGGGGEGIDNLREEGGSASQTSISYNATVSYLKLVNQTFQIQTEKFDVLVDLLRKFKSGSIRPAELKESVEELFKGHKDLISGLNALLPEEIQPDECGAKLDDTVGSRPTIVRWLSFFPTILTYLRSAPDFCRMIGRVLSTAIKKQLRLD